jgi:hypothetical protein
MHAAQHANALAAVLGPWTCRTALHSSMMGINHQRSRQALVHKQTSTARMSEQEGDACKGRVARGTHNTKHTFIPRQGACSPPTPPAWSPFKLTVIRMPSTCAHGTGARVGRHRDLQGGANVHSAGLRYCNTCSSARTLRWTPLTMLQRVCECLPPLCLA